MNESGSVIDEIMEDDNDNYSGEAISRMERKVKNTSTDNRSSKKVVHFMDDPSAIGHIELKDLSEYDFLNLIEGKN